MAERREGATTQPIDKMDIHTWFNLTYSSYLVINRSVLQSMPEEWQHRFVACLREMEDAFGHLDWPHYDVRTLKREPNIIDVPEDCGNCGGEGTVLDGDEEVDCPECDGMGDSYENSERRYETPEEVGFRTDPIPHYNRGRTQLEPRPKCWPEPEEDLYRELPDA